MAETKEIWTIGSILKWTGQYFGSKGVASPRLDAEVLLSHVLGMDRVHLYVHFDQPLEAKELTAYRALVKQRALRRPVAYILGVKEFMGLPFRVSPAVLIPRPDTEVLVEEALRRLEGMPSPHIADLGTGSGAILISILAKRPDATGIGVDISAEALAIARENAVALGVAARSDFRKGDLLQPLGEERFDALLSNPPYIPTRDIAPLEPEVQTEPRGALDGGADGLAFYRRILAQGAGYLTPRGFIAVEIGIHQAQPVCELAPAGQLTVNGVVNDLAGIPRTLVFTHPDRS